MVKRWKQAGIIGAGVSILLVLLLLTGTMSQTALRFTDILYVPQETTDQIVIIAIDDKSLSEYGRSPLEWDRSLHASLLDHLYGARVVAFDLLFIEQTEQDDVFVEALHDIRNAENGTRIVMAQAGLNASTYPGAICYTTALKPTFITDIDYGGYITTVTDVDGRIRRYNSLIYADSAPGEIGLNFALAIYMAHRRIPVKMLDVIVNQQGDMLYLTPQTPILTDEHGLWFPNFFGTPGNFPTVSYHDVIEGKVDDSLFTDKIVLVGMMNATGSTDRVLVPISPDSPMAGVEIHANAVETILQGVPLTMQGLWSQVFMVVFIALGSSVIYTRLHWIFKLVMALIFGMLVFVVASYLFSTQRLMINLWYALLAVIVPLAVALIFDTAYAIQKQERAELLLDSIVKAAQQELNPWSIHALLVKDIQRIFPQATVRIHTSTPFAFHQLQYPIRWHDRTLATITIDIPNKTQPQQEQVERLQDLIERITPSLANAELYMQGQNLNDLLRTILRESPQGIVVIDEHLRIVTANRKFSERVPDDDNDIPLPEILKQVDIGEDELQKLNDAFATHEPFQLDMEFQDSNYTVAAAPLSTNSNWVVIFMDVTPLVQLNRSKTRLLRVVSHDLKNPLQRINLYSELMGRRDPLTARQRDQLAKILSASLDMNEIITDLLDIERIESDRDGLIMSDVDLAAITQTSIEKLEDTFAEKNMIVNVDIPAQMMVRGNARLLQQSARNLLDNAAKYTPANGEIRVRLWCEDTYVYLSVRDNGIGMSKAEQEKLFTEFYRVQNKQTEGIAGTGLGLSLVKSVVRAHHGKITVESDSDAGSTFTIILPAIADD